MLDALIRKLRSRKTIDEILESHGGLGPGFDYLRIGLAVLVLSAHCSAILNGRPEQTLLIATNVMANSGFQWLNWEEPLFILIVPAFFALSGFLVTGSALRLKRVLPFLYFRALRILPALSIEVALSALVLGPLFTSLALNEYFSSSQFFAYFGNIIGIITFDLPGVFYDNPLPKIVNNSLWTLPPEFYCYAATSALMLIGIFYNKKTAIALFITVTIALAVYVFYREIGSQRGNMPPIIIVYYFFAGCIFFVLKNTIAINPVCAIICFFIAYAATYYKLVMVAPIFVTYVIVAIGVTKWPEISFLRKGDYSYGIYLYHFPIAQAIVALSPSELRSHPILFKCLALIATAFFAVLSWHFLEKPALRLKKLAIRSKDQLLPSHPAT